ncbi:ArsR/SmtB family transcription factor [Streptacidiphilus neutrinimicus]|uniref:ArsR/SmtB family transcription factor n=1 Tax=Streptacidiphilus neutrinimicus TaxID=105420 RepID=UPI0005A7C212|nr:metalloregulator ArsR/SmtB family transcription factor [Streptacidiphilus neutrinimicus]
MLGLPRPASSRLDPGTAALVATALQALATPSRLLILAALRVAPHSVTEIADQVGMERSAVSHQLRLLRTLGLVSSGRDGRRAIYRLHDDHVAQLLDQAVHHTHHLTLGIRDPT